MPLRLDGFDPELGRGSEPTELVGGADCCDHEQPSQPQGVGIAVWLRRLASLTGAILLAAPTAALASTGWSPPPAVDAAFHGYLASCPSALCAVVDANAVIFGSSRSAPASTAGASPALSNFTWRGATPQGVGASNWSKRTNWVGGHAPGGRVGTLRFPILTGAGCTTSPPADTCYQSNNDLSGLSASSLSINDGRNYTIQGNRITLGAGGLTASTASTVSGFTALSLPIALGASQTWSIDGHNLDSQVGLGANVTGASRALRINLNHQTFLGMNGRDVEVGPVTINSSASSTSSWVSLGGSKLNATDANPITLMGTGGIFAASNSTISPLTATGGRLDIGNGSSGAAILAVHGRVTLSPPTLLHLNIVKPGTKAGTDYSRLSASGVIRVRGSLLLLGATSARTCPTLHVGDVDALVTTTATLSGTFTGVPNGATVSVNCSTGVAPTVRINYRAHSVTATVLTAGGAIS